MRRSQFFLCRRHLARSTRTRRPENASHPADGTSERASEREGADRARSRSGGQQTVDVSRTESFLDIGIKVSNLEFTGKILYEKNTYLHNEDIYLFLLQTACLIICATKESRLRSIPRNIFLLQLRLRLRQAACPPPGRPYRAAYHSIRSLIANCQRGFSHMYEHIMCIQFIVTTKLGSMPALRNSVRSVREREKDA